MYIGLLIRYVTFCEVPLFMHLPTIGAEGIKHSGCPRASMCLSDSLCRYAFLHIPEWLEVFYWKWWQCTRNARSREVKADMVLVWVAGKTVW